jgi:hypothetical protein
MGRRIGLLAAQAGQRLHQVATSLHEKADRLDQPGTVPGEQSLAPTRARIEEHEKLVMERAEDLVERLFIAKKRASRHEE